MTFFFFIFASEASWHIVIFFNKVFCGATDELKGFTYFLICFQYGIAIIYYGSNFGYSIHRRNKGASCTVDLHLKRVPFEMENLSVYEN